MTYKTKGVNKMSKTTGNYTIGTDGHITHIDGRRYKVAFKDCVHPHIQMGIDDNPEYNFYYCKDCGFYQIAYNYV
jgi:DNA-directed RNA polymerase subunit M/transcription elongation factor TFIIS